MNNVIVASGQKVVFSSETKTAIHSNSQYTYKSEPGAYSFSLFVLKDHAEVTLEETGKQISFNTLEQHYGSTLTAKNLYMSAKYLILHPGSILDMTGMGYQAAEGPGQGSVVCI